MLGFLFGLRPPPSRAFSGDVMGHIPKGREALGKTAVWSALREISASATRCCRTLRLSPACWIAEGRTERLWAAWLDSTVNGMKKATTTPGQPTTTCMPRAGRPDGADMSCWQYSQAIPHCVQRPCNVAEEKCHRNSATRKQCNHDRASRRGPCTSTCVPPTTCSRCHQHPAVAKRCRRLTWPKCSVGRWCGRHRSEQGTPACPYAPSCVHTNMYEYWHLNVFTQCVCVYIHTYTRKYIHAYTPTHTCIHTYIRTYILTCIHTYIHTYIHNMSRCVYTNFCTYIFVCVWISAYMYVYM